MCCTYNPSHRFWRARFSQPCHWFWQMRCGATFVAPKHCFEASCLAPWLGSFVGASGGGTLFDAASGPIVASGDVCRDAVHVFVGVFVSRVLVFLSRTIWRRYMALQLVSAQPRSMCCVRARFLAIVVYLWGQRVLWLPTTYGWGLYSAKAAPARQAIHNPVCDAI